MENNDKETGIEITADSDDLNGKRTPIFKIKKNRKKSKFIEAEWQRIGFHRPLGGFWYNMALILASSGFALLITVWIFPNFILPFPTAIGYQDLVKSMFAFYFMLADAGIGRAVERYVADQNIKNPRKCIQYIQFFIWFQMITGIIQITIISVWVLTSVRTTQLAYASWFFLIYSLIQFPGMLGIFSGALNAFQRYDLAGKIAFLQATVLEMSTRIIFILLGRWYGRLNPEVGELMGATIGGIIGAYVDDFIAAAIAFTWLKPILLNIDPGWTMKDIVGVEFDKALVKECTWFGIKAILPSLFHTLNQLIHINLLLLYMPNYATIWGLFVTAEGISGFVNFFRFGITSPVSESYNNGKKILAQNYMIRANKWGSLGAGWMFPFMLAITPLIGLVVGERYAGITPMIGLLMVGNFANSMGGTNAHVFLGSNHPEYYFIQNLTEFVCRIGVLYLLLVFGEVGWLAIVLGRVAGWWGRFLMGVLIMNKKLFKFKLNWWQSVIVPAFAGLILYGLTVALREFILYLLNTSIGLIPVIIIGIIGGILLIPFGVYFPLYAFLGGWDEVELKIFKDAVEISGPSKWLTNFIYQMSYKISQKSPLYNKFPIESEIPLKEMEELIEIRKNNLKKNP